MQVELARTFLEVIAAGSFIGATEHLHVTQSTVSARIQLLEQQLGRRLFVRNKGGAVLTPAGTQFQRHAAALVRIWEQARQEAAVPAGHRALLRIGAEAGLWNRMLHNWVPWMREHARHIAVRCEVSVPDALTHSLLDGLLDVAVMYSPQSRPGLVVDLLAEEELVLIEARPEAGSGAGEYVYVDWGEEFRRRYRMTFPDSPSPALFIGLGTLGFDYLLRRGGSGHFPRGLAQQYLRSGRVREVPGAVAFRLPIYAVSPMDGNDEILTSALDGLRAVVAAAVDGADDGTPYGEAAGPAEAGPDHDRTRTRG
jgi:DNA-binding transcriptional LysR family regulator